jgi:hypothetical protein
LPSEPAILRRRSASQLIERFDDWLGVVQAAIEFLFADGEAN